MAMFSRSEEEQAARDAAKMAKQQEAAAKAYWASPVGQAESAYHNGDGFFQVEMPHSSMRGYANLAWSSGTTGVSARRVQAGSATDVLAQIESVGWRLEQASWVYIQTGQSSRDKMLASGQVVAVTGEVVGIYLFRRLSQR